MNNEKDMFKHVANPKNIYNLVGYVEMSKQGAGGLPFVFPSIEGITVSIKKEEKKTIKGGLDSSLQYEKPVAEVSMTISEIKNPALMSFLLGYPKKSVAENYVYEKEQYTVGESGKVFIPHLAKWNITNKEFEKIEDLVVKNGVNTIEATKVNQEQRGDGATILTISQGVTKGDQVTIEGKQKIQPYEEVSFKNSMKFLDVYTMQIIGFDRGDDDKVKTRIYISGVSLDSDISFSIKPLDVHDGTVELTFKQTTAGVCSVYEYEAIEE